MLIPSVSLRIRFAALTAVILAVLIGLVAVLSVAAAATGNAAIAGLVFAAAGLGTLLLDRTASQLLYRRLFQMRDTMRRVASGQLSARALVNGADEIGMIASGMNEILDGLERLTQSIDLRVATETETLRRRNEEIAGSHQQLAVLSEELARAGRLAALGQAAATMAHQIGTPLNLISGHVQLMVASSPPDSAASERLRAIQDQIEKVTAIVRAALDSSRPAVIPHEVTDLARLVKRVCQISGPMLDNARVQTVIVVPDAAIWVLADAVQLELALLNLITNSVDAMPGGGTLAVRLTQTSGRAHIAVEDSGSGVRPDLITRIFDPWVTTKAPGKGSGLGLSIARQVVASHGGSIAVNSRPEGGSIFTIDLPTNGAVAAPSEDHVSHPDR